MHVDWSRLLTKCFYGRSIQVNVQRCPRVWESPTVQKFPPLPYPSWQIKTGSGISTYADNNGLVSQAQDYRSKACQVCHVGRRLCRQICYHKKNYTTATKRITFPWRLYRYWCSDSDYQPRSASPRPFS